MSPLHDQARDRQLADLRDTLFRDGPMTVAEASAASGVESGRILSFVRDGTLVPTAATRAASACTGCRAPAESGDLCGSCRRGLLESSRPARPAAASAPRDWRSGAFHSSRRRWR